MHRLAVGALAGLAALAGCLGAKTTHCSNGATCPDPLVCTGNSVEPFCEERISVEQCMGKPDETPCIYQTEKNGYCLANACAQCNPNYSFCKYEDWTRMMFVGAATDAELRSVWASGPTDLYIVGAQGAMIRWDGRQWSAFTNGIAAGAEYESIWGFDPTSIFVVTVGQFSAAHVFRYDGSQWIAETQGPAAAMNAVWGSAANNVYAVGVGVGHYTGSWMNTASSLLYGVTGHDATVLAVGNPPNNVLRKNGAGAFMPEATATNHFLFDVSAVGATEYAVGRTNAGNAPALLRHDTTWSDVSSTLPSSASTFELNAVLVLSSSDVYAVGKGGTIVHYDGSQWTAMTSGVGVTLNEIFATDTDIFVVGAAGTILRRSR